MSALSLLSACRAADPQTIAFGSASPLSIASPVGAWPAGGGVVFIPDVAGPNDDGLNALTLRGLRSEAQRLGQPEPAVAAPEDPSAYAGTVQRAAGQARLVVGRGAPLGDAFLSAVAAHPNVMFVLIDAPPSAMNMSNLRTITFDLNDAVVVAGKLAAAVSQRHVVAFAGGKRTEEAQQLAASFSQGASGANVITAFSGGDDNQADAKRLAEGLISDRGADVVFAAAMPAGLGTIAAASQHRVLAIGLGRDDYDVAPNAVISSVTKFTDVVAAQALAQFSEGALTGGHSVVGMGQGAAGLAALRDLADRVPPPVRQQLGIPG